MLIRRPGGLEPRGSARSAPHLRQGVKQLAGRLEETCLHPKAWPEGFLQRCLRGVTGAGVTSPVSALRILHPRSWGRQQKSAP